MTFSLRKDSAEGSLLSKQQCFTERLPAKYIEDMPVVIHYKRNHVQLAESILLCPQDLSYRESSLKVLEQSNAVTSCCTSLCVYVIHSYLNGIACDNINKSVVTKSNEDSFIDCVLKILPRFEANRSGWVCYLDKGT